MAPKKKQEKMSLGDFLGDQSLGSWADEMEDMPMPRGAGGSSSGYGGDRPSYSAGGGGGFGGDRPSYADRGFATREELPLPSKPPYTAHLGNLSFDATAEDVGDFFGDCEVTNVRIVEDKMDRKPKGFGYVEFGSVDGLKKALALSGTQFQGRNIRVSVAEPPKDRVEAREITDWTRKGPLPDLPGQRDRGGFGSGAGGGFTRGGGGGGFDAASDAGSDRGERRRAPPFASDGKDRDFSNWERKGPLSPAASAPNAMAREGRQASYQSGSREQGASPSWGEGRPDSRGPRREFQPSERPQVDRQPTAPELDNQWRTKMRADAPSASPTATPDASTPSSPAPAPAAPATRPRLNLAKRTVSEAGEPTPTSTTSNRPNPFGAARPIDTATREKEIEEKNQLELRQKKEADDKTRDEKRAKEASERVAQKDAAPAASAEKSGADAGAETEAAEQDEDANGEIVDDKAVKPQEVVRDPPKAEGAWRRKDTEPAAPEGTTTEEMDDDGWSTVTKPKATRGRGGPPARAIAS